MTKTIDISELKPEQIKQLQAIVDTFKRQNELEKHNSLKENRKELDSLEDIFFESEIIQPFNRNMLYGDRI